MQLYLFAVPENVKKLEVENVGQTSFNLKWENPEGEKSGYGITYGKTGEATTKANVTELNRQIENLEAGTKYTATVYTFSGSYRSSGSSIDITTSKLLGVNE